MEDSNSSMDPPRCVSYLQARDPSILSWNRPGIEKVRQNLASQFSSESTITIPSIKSEKQDDSLRVHLRIKGGVTPNDIYTIEDNILICTVPEGSQAARNNRDKTVVIKKKYKFSSIFGPSTSQVELFDSIIKDKILSVINGHNSTLLAYGASGAGKTFTMVGTAEMPGIIPRSLDYLFRTLANNTGPEPNVKPLAHGKIELLSGIKVAHELQVLKSILHDPQTFSERNQHIKTYKEMQTRLSSNQVGIVHSFPPIVDVWVSFAEIYNEMIYDLLAPLPGRGQHRKKLKIGGLQDDTYIRGLKYVYVRSGLEAYQVLQYGLQNLSYAATAVNQHSSRSHCIFSIRLVAGHDEKNCNLSMFNFCDLAGSERLKKTLNEGDRLKESTKINTSLSVLGRCISNIRDTQHSAKDNNCSAPFRESKLTMLFQKALQGKEDILMIVNINPSPDMFDDSQQALIFSAIAKQIVTQEVPPKTIKPTRFSSYRQKHSLSYLKEEEEEINHSEEVCELREEIASLVLDMAELKERADNMVEAERRHLRTNYDAIIQLKDGQLKGLRAEVENLNQAVEQLEKEKRQLRRELLTKEEVIILSSEDSDSEDSKLNGIICSNSCNHQNLLDEIKNQKKELEKFQLEREELRKNDIENRAKIEELEKTLMDACLDYDIILKENKNLRSQVSEVTARNFTLESELEVQNQELECLRPLKVELYEEIDRLEDLNQELRLGIKKQWELPRPIKLDLYEEIDRLEDPNQELMLASKKQEELPESSSSS